MKNHPILFLSGWAHGEEVFLPLAEKIGMRGPVASLCPASCELWRDGDEKISSYARAVSAHLDKWSDPACIIGWSAGGVAAIETAARYPEKCAGLVLLSATARFCSQKEYACGVRPAVLRAMIAGLQKTPEAVLKDFISRALYPLEAAEDLLAQRTEAALCAGVDSLAWGLKYLASADFRSDISSIPHPCLIIHGQKDMIVPWEAGRYLHQNLSRSHLELLPSAGHSLMEQCPEDISRPIAKFLEQL
ncbi:MAG: alpha/beta fold hydrolase [Syntrophobacteraceae bacterium]